MDPEGQHETGSKTASDILKLEVADDGDSPTPPPVCKVGKLTFDPHGDIILVIPCGSAVARFQVNSSVLCLASPVFRAILGPNSRFKEGTNLKLATIGGQKSPEPMPMELQLSDDDPNALAVILRILHLQFDWIPTPMSPSQGSEGRYKLYEMAIICDKYDMRHILLYWLKMWTTPLLKELNYQNIAMATTIGSDWLFITYAFGYPELFRLVSKELALNCHMTSSGELFLPSDKHHKLDTYYLPQSIVGKSSYAACGGELNYQCRVDFH